MTSSWMTRGWEVTAVVVLLSCLTTTPQSVHATDPPRDANGLPLWVVREYDDFPVRIALADHRELAELLRAVSLPVPEREWIKPERTPAGEQRLYFEPRVTAAQARALTTAGYAYSLLPDRQQQERREMERIWAEQVAAGGDRFRYGERGVYHTHAQIGAILQQTELDHPDIADFDNIGLSFLGRELWLIRITDNVQAEEAEPEVRLSSTMHGDEPPGLEMLLFLVEYLTDNYGQPGYEDVTYLVDHYDLFIIPCHNPDGLAAGMRRNANGIDLNRNFPVPNGNIGWDGTWTEEVETILFKEFGFAHNFVISENGHSGALVVNYPWDYTYDLTPDDSAIIQLSLEYSTYNLPMYNGSFPQGITHGAQWYVVEGSLQDWSYEETGCIDVTIEYSDIHTPPASQLETLWDDNRESFMHWIRAARYGVGGIVTAAKTGLPLAATVTVAGNEKPVQADPDHGDYYKLLDTGTYDLTFAAEGYVTHTEYGVSTVWGTPTLLDVALDKITGLANGPLSATPEAAGIRLTTWYDTTVLDGVNLYRRPDGGASVRLTAAPLFAADGRIDFLDSYRLTDGMVLYYQYGLVSGDEEIGRSEEVAIAVDGPVLAAPVLYANHPNPCNPLTCIPFELPRPERIELEILDARGRHVSTLIDGELPGGRHRAFWSGRDADQRPVASGVYLYRLTTSERVLTRRLLLVK